MKGSHPYKTLCHKGSNSALRKKVGFAYINTSVHTRPKLHRKQAGGRGVTVSQVANYLLEQCLLPGNTQKYHTGGNWPQCFGGQMALPGPIVLELKDAQERSPTVAR